MRTLDDVRASFAYHPATPETAATYVQIRQSITTCAEQLWDLIPDGPDRTLVMRDLQRALQMACYAVAMTTPADTDTPEVARVLPSDTLTFGTCACGALTLYSDEVKVFAQVEHQTGTCRPAP